MPMNSGPKATMRRMVMKVLVEVQAAVPVASINIFSVLNRTRLMFL